MYYPRLGLSFPTSMRQARLHNFSLLVFFPFWLLDSGSSLPRPGGKYINRSGLGEEGNNQGEDGGRYHAS